MWILFCILMQYFRLRAQCSVSQSLLSHNIFFNLPCFYLSQFNECHQALLRSQYTLWLMNSNSLWRVHYYFIKLFPMFTTFTKMLHVFLCHFSSASDNSGRVMYLITSISPVKSGESCEKSRFTATTNTLCLLHHNAYSSPGHTLFHILCKFAFLCSYSNIFTVLSSKQSWQTSVTPVELRSPWSLTWICLTRLSK